MAYPGLAPSEYSSGVSQDAREHRQDCNSHAPRAGGGCVGLSPSREQDGRFGAAGWTYIRSSAGNRLERPEATMAALPNHESQGQADGSGRHRRCPRTRWLRLGHWTSCATIHGQGIGAAIMAVQGAGSRMGNGGRTL